MLSDIGESLGTYYDAESSEKVLPNSVDSNVSYELGSFVLVKATRDDSHVSFWLEKVPSTISSESGVVSKLQVHCVDSNSHAQRLTG